MQMPLTDVAIRNAKPKEKSYKMSDILGLFLLISPSGSKLWRMKYHFKGAEKKLSLGAHPGMSLRDARKQRDEARDLLAEGKDPSFEKQREKLRAHALAANTFTSISRERAIDPLWKAAT